MTNTHSTLLLTNGQSVEIPYISEAGAGWILKPDEARSEHDIQRGLNKSFGRSHEGREASRLWRREYLQDQFNKADWAPLLHHDYGNDINGPGGEGITFSVQDPLYGWNVMRFKVAEPNRYRSDDEYEVWITWEGTAIQSWYMNREVTDAHPFAWTQLYQAHYRFQSNEKKKIYQMAEEFAADPMEYVKEKTLADLPWNFDDDQVPPLDWGHLKPISHYLDDAETFHIEVDRNHVFWRKGNQAQSIFVAAAKEVNMLERAFQHLGIDIRVGTGVNYDIAPGEDGYRQEGLRSIEFIIPADKQDEHNFLGHTIKVSLSSIQVVCGYRHDELKWEKWKAREAADWLTEYEQETTPDIEEYDFKPN